MIGSWALQVAIYDLLRLAGIAGGRVHDQLAVPPNVTFPYVQFGATEARRADAVGIDGTDELLPLHIWDRGNETGGQRGIKQVSETADRIHTLLHGQQIYVEGRDIAFCSVQDFTPLPEADPLTAHGVLTLRVQHYKKQA
jgi:Protein of unknown function (DUF3168)